MRYYATSRRLPALGALAVVAAVLPALLGVTIGFPDVIGSGGGSIITMSTLTPYLLAIALAWALTARRTHLSDHALRRTEALDSAILLILNLIVLLLVTVLPNGDPATSRNTALLTGATSVIISLSSPAAASAAITFTVLFIVTYGQSAPGSRFVRVLQAPPSELIPVAVAAVLLTVGALSLLKPSQESTRPLLPSRRTPNVN